MFQHSANGISEEEKEWEWGHEIKRGKNNSQNGS